jgi:hypothetical protein
MQAGKRTQLPKDLLRAQGRFLAWRTQRTTRSPIPQPLWDLAVRLVHRHGLARIASALKLDYYSLKKRALPTADTATPAPPSVPAFVELPAGALLGKQCLCEIHHRAGASMRLQLLGCDTADVEGLVRLFVSTR